MKLKLNALVRRLELDFYTTLTSLIGGVQRIRAKAGHQNYIPPQPPFIDEMNIISPVEQLLSIPSTKRSTYFGQVFITVLIWIVLGFSAGFLIGMLNSG